MSVFAERQAKKLELKRKFEAPPEQCSGQAEAAAAAAVEKEDDDQAESSPTVAAVPSVASGKLAELPLLLRPKDAIAPSMLHQRQKQIDIGKNTRQYRRYVSLVPKSQRTAEHPRTPDPRKSVSRRQFDGLLRQWRQLLHRFDDGVDDGDGDDAHADRGEQEQQEEVEIDIRTLAEEWASIERELVQFAN
jgi:hypothetical protein